MLQTDWAVLLFWTFPTGATMKSFLLAAILGVTLLTPSITRADASEQGCKSSGEKADGCGKGSKEWGKGWWKNKNDVATVPEPGIGILVGSGLLALGGIVLLRRKREAN